MSDETETETGTEQVQVNMGPPTDVGAELMGQMVDLAAAHDPDVAVVLVLHGSPVRGLAASYWSVFEGPDAEVESLGLVANTVIQLLEAAAKDRGVLLEPGQPEPDSGQPVHGGPSDGVPE